MSKTVFERSWLTVALGFDLAFKVQQYHERRVLVLGLVFLTLYIPFRERPYDWNVFDSTWGVYWFIDSVNFCWGQRHWCWRAPWAWEHVRHEVLYPDGRFGPPTGESWDKEDGRLTETHLYKYVLESGTVQRRMATCYAERREWRWRWFTWLPWPRMRSQSIDVSFDSEVGERTGSWKGGTIGCGWDMRPGETIKQVLSRMERERKFE